MAGEAIKGRVTGLSGVFVKSADPGALAAWYARNLGLELEKWGGAILRYDRGTHPPAAVWNSYSEPSKREFMVCFTVDDIDALLTRLRENQVDIVDRNDDDSSGRFAWIVDPDGTKIELWEPAS